PLGCFRLLLGEQVAAKLPSLPQIHQQYLCLGVGIAGAVDRIQPLAGRFDDQPCVIGWKRELADDPFRELRLVRVEHTGADADPYLLAERALRPELFTCPGGIGGHGLADWLDVMQALAESAAAADLLFWLRLVIQIQARHAAQFPGCFL